MNLLIDITKSYKCITVFLRLLFFCFLNAKNDENIQKKCKLPDYTRSAYKCCRVWRHKNSVKNVIFLYIDETLKILS